MRVTPTVQALGYAGLVPFIVDPAWRALAPAGAPAWLDAAWIAYVTLVAAFLAGSFWGFALLEAEGPDGLIGVLMASGLMLLTWGTMLLAMPLRADALIVVFLLLLLADFWRERTLDTIPGYFRLRSTLTVGVLLALCWRLLERA